MDVQDLTSVERFGYRPGLDGLRAVAVIAVVAFHAGLLDGGWTGVDIFFVLSGWLITGLLLGEIATTGRLDLWAFWRRRIRRLVPAIIVTLAFVTVLGVSGAIDVRRRGVIGALTYSTNWLNITGGDGYWDAFAAPDPLRHLWSLAVEEQIYVVWPVVVLLVVRLVRRHSAPARAIAIRAVATLVAIASVGLAVHGATNGWSLDRLYQGTDTRASAFACGALVAGLSVPRLGDRVRHLMVILAVACAVALGASGGSLDVFRWPIHVVTLCGVIAVTTAAGVRSGPLCWAPVRRLGTWSYGIYLVHFPITVALDDRLDPLWLTLAVLALSVPIAALSHRLVEQPIRRDGLHGRRGATAVVGAIAIAAAAVLIAVPATPAGLDDLPTLADPAPSTAPPASGVGAVSTTTPPQGRRILVVGDSVPALAADELATVAFERGDRLGVVAREGCVGSPHRVDQFLEERCIDFIADLPRAIAAQEPEAVVWWWGGAGTTQVWNGAGIDVCSLAGFAAASGQVAWEVEASGAARPVIVIAPARTDLGRDAAEGAACQAAALVDAATRAGVEVIRLDQFVCPDPADDCERVDRVDGLHFQGEAAEAVASWMLAQPALESET